MLFKRRDKQPIYAKIASWLWPRRGLSRTFKYLWFRVARLPGTPYSIAAGFASGAAVSFTPFLGLHFLMGFFVAWILRGNLFASAIGTFIGNPWTFPFMFALNTSVGAAILGEEYIVEMPEWSWGQIWDAPGAYISSLLPAFFPTLIGSIPTVIVAWVLCYFVFKWFLKGYHQRRMDRKKPDYLTGEGEE